jgi:hypothetical protein
MNLKIVSGKEDGRYTAVAPCGKRVHVPAGSSRGELLYCEACGKYHRLVKTNGDGKSAKLAVG